MIRILAASACLMILWSCSTHSPTRPTLPAEVALTAKVGREPVFLKLRLETGEELQFMLDTGSPSTTLDKSLESKLGKRIGSKKVRYGWKVYGAPMNGVYAAPKLYLGNTPLQTGAWVYTDDLTRLWPGRPMMGILGMDCLRNYCLQFDFPARKLRFLDPDHLQLGNLGKAFPLTLVSGDVTTRMDFFGQKNVCFHLDSADWADGALKSDLFALAIQKQEFAWIGQWKDTNNPQGPLLRQAYLPGIALNHETYTNLVFRDCSIGATQCRNILGLAFFARNLTTLNFPKRTMYLKQTSVGPFINENKSTNVNAVVN